MVIESLSEDNVDIIFFPNECLFLCNKRLFTVSEVRESVERLQTVLAAALMNSAYMVAPGYRAQPFLSYENVCPISCIICNFAGTKVRQIVSMDEEEQTAYVQRLKAAVHYTTGLICRQMEEEKEVQFTQQIIAAIAETAFKQCGQYKFNYHLTPLDFICQKSEELAADQQEKKEKKKKTAGKGKKRKVHIESDVSESEDSNML
ncbi:CENPS protein, partial [Polypterus senegalus]